MTHGMELASQSSLLDLSGDGSEWLRVFYTISLEWECLDPSPGREFFVSDKKKLSHVISSHGEFPKRVWGSFGIPGGLYVASSPWTCIGKQTPERHCPTFPGMSSLT